MSDRNMRQVPRRKLLKVSGAGLAAGVAGCTGNGDGGSGDDDSDPGDSLPEVELYDADGNRIQPTIIHDQGSDTALDIASQIVTDLEQIGADAEAVGRAEVLGEDFFSEPLPDEDPDDFEYGPVGRNAGPPDRTRTVFDWDLLYGIGANSYPRTPGDTDVFWRADSAVNAYGYVPEVDMDQLYSDFRNAEEQAERQELLNEIMGALTEELPANFLSQGLDFFGVEEQIRLADDFTQYGNSLPAANRYRNEQEVGGDFVVLDGVPFAEAFLPEQDDNNSAERTTLLTDYSYVIDAEDNIVPQFFDIENSGDDTVWICSLRDNLRFGTDADGNSYGQMTAEDWVFQAEYVHGVADDASDFWDEEVPPSEAIGSYDVIENIEQTGELEFQVELEAPDGLFPFRPTLWAESCLPMELFEEYAPDAQALRESTEVQEFTWTGNLGPYTFDSRTPGQSGEFTVVRNDEYYMREHTEESNVQVMDDAWADAPYFDLYQYDVDSEESTRVERMRSGEGDIMGLPTEVIQEFEEDPDLDDIRVEEQQDPYINFLFFNQRANGSILTRERDGREAIARVIDKETITEDIQRGYAEPAVTHQPTWSEWYDESAVTPYGIDITEDDIIAARDLLRDNDNFTLEDV